MSLSKEREKEIRCRLNHWEIFHIYYVGHIDGPSHVSEDLKELLAEIDRLRNRITGEALKLYDDFT
jgi:hypothetical protein